MITATWKHAYTQGTATGFGPEMHVSLEGQVPAKLSLALSVYVYLSLSIAHIYIYIYIK